MAGIFGIASKHNNNTEDLFLGTHYLQHRAQEYGGFATFNGYRVHFESDKGLVRQNFPKEKLEELKGDICIGSVSTENQPIHVLGKAGTFIFCFDGNLRPSKETEYQGFRDSSLISRVISQEDCFEKGIESLVNQVEGDFAIVSLAREGIYAARGLGRKPLILGQKNGSYAVSSESNSFINTGIKIIRDVEPGEVVLLTSDGVETVTKLDIQPIKYGTFEWVYTAYPASIIDGRLVANVRRRIGEALAKQFPVEADIVSPVPNSGRWHAVGYAEASGITFQPIFIRYDYSDRSFTPQQQIDRDFEAKTKLIPIESLVEGKRIILIDDSIVRGTQTRNQVIRLREMGAKEIHVRIACPPLMHACSYGQTTKEDNDCIASKISIKEIQEKLKLDSLEYATIPILEKSTGYPREMLCLECWGK